jgi:hypothetical protein
MFHRGSVLENIHIQKQDTLARAPSRPPKMYQYILCQKVRPSKMYQYISKAPLRPPKMYQYILCHLVRPSKMYQYILDQK